MWARAAIAAPLDDASAAICHATAWGEVSCTNKDFESGTHCDAACVKVGRNCSSLGLRGTKNREGCLSRLDNFTRTRDAGLGRTIAYSLVLRHELRELLDLGDEISL